MSTEVFRRVEKKYLITKAQYDDLIKVLDGKIEKNKYHFSTISNIYYDTKDFSLIRNSIEKPVYKEKVRLRSYNTPKLEDKIFLEVKKKYKGIVGKKRVKIPLQDFYKFYYIKKFNIDSIVMEEIKYMFSKYELVPAIYVGYERYAYQGVEDKNFRLTFDFNLRYREYELKLEYGDEGTKLFDEDMYIMEVKTLDAIPLWFCKILSELNIYSTSFSKYGEIYKQIMRKGLKGEIYV